MLNITKHSLEAPPHELPIYMLRLEVQHVIEHYTEVFQCPRDFIVSAVFDIVSCLVGQHVQIFDGKYRNCPNHWICHIAPSGSNKSAPVKSLMEPLFREQSKRHKAYLEACAEYKKGNGGEVPKMDRLIVSDVTPEALYMVLGDKNGSKDGLMLYRDEIKGFMDDMERYHSSGEVSNYLYIWDGTSFPVTRKTQEELYVEDPFLSIMGGIQPSVVSDTFKKKLADVGFVQRWLFVYPDVIPVYEYSEMSLDAICQAAWNEMFTKLLAIQDMTLTLSPGAKKLYIAYCNETWRRQLDVTPWYASMLAKLRIQLEKWCVVAHLLASSENAGNGQFFAIPSSTEITEEEMKYSIECMRYFEHCGDKVLRLIIGEKATGTMTQAQMIADLVHNIGQDKVNLQKLADAIGVTRQYVSKVVNQQDRLRSCGSVTV